MQTERLPQQGTPPSAASALSGTTCTQELQRGLKTRTISFQSVTLKHYQRVRRMAAQGGEQGGPVLSPFSDRQVLIVGPIVIVEVAVCKIAP